jgi:hypothetical protein
MALIICFLTVCGIVPLITGILMGHPLLTIGGAVMGAASLALAVRRKIYYEIDHLRITEP